MVGKSDKSRAEGLSRRRFATWWAPLAVAAVALLVFGRVVTFDFLTWDDEQHVVGNLQVNPPSWNGLVAIWQRPYFGLYIPLSYTLYAAEAAVGQRPPAADRAGSLAPGWFHAGNLAMHAANALLVFVLLRRFLRKLAEGTLSPDTSAWRLDTAAAAGALFWALHPLQVESVAWISEARGLLCALFSLICMEQYTRVLDARSSASETSRPRLHYAMAVAAFVLASLAKPMAAAVPIMLLILDWGMWRQPAGKAFRRLTPFVIVAAGLLVLTKNLQPNDTLSYVPSWWQRPLLAGDALAFYLGKLLMPWPLGPDYARPPEWVLKSGWLYFGWLAPVLAIAAMLKRHDERVWLLAAALLAAWLIPVLGLVPFDYQRFSTVADRYLYVAMIGPALALGWLVLRRWSPATLWAAGVGVVAIGTISVAHLGVWANSTSLFTYTLHMTPRSGLAYCHLGEIETRNENYAAAMANFREAVKDPRKFPEIYVAWGNALFAARDPDAARHVFQEGVRRYPEHAVLRRDLAGLEASRGQFDEAIKGFRKAIELAPGYIDARLDLGRALAQTGKLSEGIEECSKAVISAPQNPEAHLELGILYSMANKLDRAREQYEMALDIFPGMAAAHCGLGNIAAKLPGRLDEAVTHYNDAIQFDPKLAEAHANLGTALLEQGHTDQAIDCLRTAIRLEPRLFTAHTHLGRALAAKDRCDEAMAEFRKALELVAPGGPQSRAIRVFMKQSGFAAPDAP